MCFCVYVSVSVFGGYMYTCMCMIIDTLVSYCICEVIRELPLSVLSYTLLLTIMYIRLVGLGACRILLSLPPTLVEPWDHGDVAPSLVLRGDLNSGPHTYTASPLLIEPFLQPISTSRMVSLGEELENVAALDSQKTGLGSKETMVTPLLQQNLMKHTILDLFPETKPYSEAQISMNSIIGQNEPDTAYE